MTSSVERKQHHAIKSVVFFTNYGSDPCAYLRLRGPMKHLGVEVIDGKKFGKPYPDLARSGDVVVIQRDFPRDLQSYEKIVQICHDENKPIIFDIDDLLFLLPEDHPDRQSQFYVESLLPMLQVLHEADLITTTTLKLKQWLSEYHENIILLPNYLDDALWSLRSPILNDHHGEPLIIGYMGSESHMPDLEFIEPVLCSILQKYPENVILHFWGTKPPGKLAGLKQVKWSPAATYDYENFAAYFQSQNADIFIAPLIDNDFNRSKSPLKFFEYSALGAPGIFSKIDTFDGIITHNTNGLLAYSLEDWEVALAKLIDEKNLRDKLIRNAQETIKNDWLLSKNAFRWINAYNEAYQIRKKRTRGRSSRSRIITSVSQQYTRLIVEKNQEIDKVKTELSLIKNSRSWKFTLMLKKLKNLPIINNPLSKKMVNILYQGFTRLRSFSINRKRKALLQTLLETEPHLIHFQEVPEHKDEIDIIICVHNALEDVHKCLNSVISVTNHPFNVIIVDDGSDNATKNYLADFSNSHLRCKLIRNDVALGYTYAANIGMKASKAPFLVLLNSDTIVTKTWLDRMYRAMTSDQNIGIVSPLSNTASWQSVPKLVENGDWAMNYLPNGVSVERMGELIGKYSACIHPQVPLLNGFCLMIRKKVIEQIGLFDEENFGRGYGEEDDFVIRLNNAGWKSVVVDDAYLFHAQSKSYTNEGRFELQKHSSANLRKKHSKKLILQKVEMMNPNRVMEGIRARSSIMFEREHYLTKGREDFNNKRVLFVLPVRDAGGGANVILDEAFHMQHMGVNVGIFNLTDYKWAFTKNYSHVDIPFLFGKPSDLVDLAHSYDAVIASAHYSVPWLEPLSGIDKPPILGYYIQGFEPLMYPNDSEEYHQALNSYTYIKEIKRFTKTMWTRNTVLENTGADSAVIGISVNIDLFRPRDVIPFGIKPLTIVAMIRPSSTYRNPDLTVDILREIQNRYKNDVDIWFFGANDIREVVSEDRLNFKWRQLGKLTQVQVAAMMSKADIFTDFSSHQAMGLSALEAMSAGSAVLVPLNGGAVEFVDHQINGMVVDTTNPQSCLNTLEQVIQDNQLRTRIQVRGIHDVVQHFPEKASYNILKAIFT